MKNLIALIMIFFTITSYADNKIRNQIEEIERNKIITQKSNVDITPYTLPNGKVINLDDWQLVIFMQSTCSYCHTFDPIIKDVAANMSMKTFVFSFDNKSDGNFEFVYPVTDEIVSTFFRDLPVATPTTFLVNVHNLTTAPVSQGSMAKVDFENKIKETFMLLEELK